MRQTKLLSGAAGVFGAAALAAAVVFGFAPAGGLANSTRRPMQTSPVSGCRSDSPTAAARVEVTAVAGGVAHFIGLGPPPAKRR